MAKDTISQKIQAEQEAKAVNIASRKSLEPIMTPRDKKSFPLGMRCECSNPNCTARIEVPVAQRKIRAANCFFIKSGHQDLAVDTVIESYGSYLVVKKELLKA